MTNPMFNPQPHYSGVTIQISNPAVNVNPYENGVAIRNGNYAACPQACYCNQLPNETPAVYRTDAANQGVTNPIEQTDYSGNSKQTSGYPQSYPAEYYMNNYNNPNTAKASNTDNNIQDTNRDAVIEDNFNTQNFEQAENAQSRRVDPEAGISPYKDYARTYEPKQPEDLTASKTIIGALDERNAEIRESKKNTKEVKIMALTDEYIMSLENYLNNPNDEIRLMASKEVLTRLDEDKDRYDDAALNALLNKMLQDPSKLIRLAALSAFASQLASGNDYTVQLLQNIQANPNADQEDALQAADILLKMSSGVEVKNVPESEVKREQYKMKVRKTA